MTDSPIEKLHAVQRAEEVLQDADQLLRVVWEHTSEAMALSAPDGTVLAVNPAYCHLYGFTPEEVIGNTFAIIFPKEQQPWAHILYQQMFTSPVISPPVETPVIRSDGTERFVESRYTFLPSVGQRKAMLSLIRDLTTQKRREEALEVSEHKLRLVLQASQVGIWDWDIASDTVQWTGNREATFDPGPERSKASYEEFLKLVHPHDRIRVDQQIKRALEEGGECSMEYRVVLSEGTIRWVKTLGQSIANEAGQPIRMVGVGVDITQQKHDLSATPSLEAPPSERGYTAS